MRLRPKARIDVLSGFLGSGKTTLLRNHLAGINADRVAVVVNEFGAAAIDHRLLRYGDDRLRVLASGCACCAVADRMRQLLLELLREDAREGGQRFERIVLETSGLADPSSILNTIRSDENLAEYLEIGACVVTFDVVDGATSAERYPEVRNQLAMADTVVLTKADLAGHDAAERARQIVQNINPLAQLHVAGASDFNVARVFDYRHGAAALPPDVSSRHAAGIRSFCLRIYDEMDWASFSVWLTCLLNRHGSRILRFKGILESTSYVRPLVIHGVRHLVYPPQHLPESTVLRGYSDLVFIVDGLNPSTIDASLRRFLAFSSDHVGASNVKVVAKTESPAPNTRHRRLGAQTI